MNVQGSRRVKENQPPEPDDGWWSAILADEPMVEEEVLPVDPVLPKIPLEDASSTSSINWEKVHKVYIGDEIIALNVVGFNRGGVLVAREDVHGFVPASHLIDLPTEYEEGRRDEYLNDYLGRSIKLKIIECEQEKDRIVFSERAALAGEGQRRHLLNSLSPGDVVEGIVTNVTDFGVFIDLGGLEGLIHVSELSWGRVQHPSKVLSVDDVVKTVVLQVSVIKGRVALSLKQLKENPWEALVQKISSGDVIPAVITNIVKFGAFAQLTEGVEGLIHISSMNFPQGSTRIDDFLFEGQNVMVCILHIDAKKRRLGLKLESYSSD